MELKSGGSYGNEGYKDFPDSEFFASPAASGMAAEYKKRRDLPVVFLLLLFVFFIYD